MADSNSPAFMPPMNRIIDDDPQIIKVSMKKVEFAARESQQPSMDGHDAGPIKHIANGN